MRWHYRIREWGPLVFSVLALLAVLLSAAGNLMNYRVMAVRLRYLETEAAAFKEDKDLFVAYVNSLRIKMAEAGLEVPPLPKELSDATD